MSRACLTPSFQLSDGSAAGALRPELRALGTLVQDFGALKTALKQPVIFDDRNLYDPAIRSQGFEYLAIGR